MPKMPKVRLRRRHVRKVLMIVAYGFVALIMVVGMVAPTLSF